MSFLKNLIKSVISSEVKKEVNEAIRKEPWNRKQNVSEPWQQRPDAQPAYAARPTSGESWGPDMPDELNQFNSGMSYTAYFRSVFSESFPQYRLECDFNPKGRDYSVFTFWEGARKALIVEIRSKTRSSQRLMFECERQGIPYLRFYHNHHGWWNTKAYVIKRVDAALRR